MSRGLAAGVAAYALWGLLPLYWKLLGAVPPLELLAHRIVWSLVALGAVVAVAGRLPGLLRALDRRTVGIYALASVLVGTNWLLYVWAVAAGRVVEVSLGYFVNPMVSVLLGVAVLGERLSRVQRVGVACAGVGVGALLVGSGSPPWVSLTLAVSFGLYGLVKKLAPLRSAGGAHARTAILTPPSLVAVGWLQLSGVGALGRHGVGFDALLLLSGVATSLPLLLFGVAARQVPLSQLGLLQYLAPTLQLVLAVAVFGEPFGPLRAAAFAAVWLGIAVFVSPVVRRAWA
ncbi:MAG: EamA family transporter RarD [Myxococcota bacterium]